MLLTAADKIYAGNKPATAVYVGSKKVWPTWKPSTISGLAMWLDAADYRPGTWLNRGSGAQPGFIGSPPPVVSTTQLNGRPVVRFSKNEGRVRIPSGTGVFKEWTLVYVGRMVGPFAGRIVTGIYSPANLLVGYWNNFQDVMYDSGFTNPNTQTAWTTDWKMYGGDGSDTPSTHSRLLSIGELLGTTGTAEGWKDTFSISGYDPTLRYDEEACDCEVAEVILYNRRLPDVERVQVEDYLRKKWGIAPPPPPYDPDTTAYLTATGLNVSYAPVLDKLVKDLKAAGLWTKMNAIYPFIGGTAALHKWNLKDPRDLDAAYRLTFLGPNGGAHSTALGYRPNPQGLAANGNFADTHFVPLGTLAQDSTHLAFYSLQDVPAGDRAEMGCFAWGPGNARFHIIARYQGVNAYYYGMSEAGATNTPVPAASGLFVATRTAAATQSAYRNGALLNASGVPSITLPNVSVYIGAINEFLNRSDIPVGFASIGSGLDDRNNTDLYNIVQAYQTALSRQV
jgi:hypothetical protein